jgi:hypothetical protein
MHRRFDFIGWCIDISPRLRQADMRGLPVELQRHIGVPLKARVSSLDQQSIAHGNAGREVRTIDGERDRRTP